MSLASRLAELITSIATDIKNILTSKQDTLNSGVNIKTINGASILGSGDIQITVGNAARVFSGPTPPAGAEVNDFWFNDEDGGLSVYYENNGTPVWVSIVNKNVIPTVNNNVLFIDGGTAEPRIPSVIISGGIA